MNSAEQTTDRRPGKNKAGGWLHGGYVVNLSTKRTISDRGHLDNIFGITIANLSTSSNRNAP